MTSADLRRSFLDFFRAKQHAIVPSSPLLPDAPNLLFTNAGMNQFVPIFLGQQPCPWRPARAADTQKCIRAGGKHNDLEDVGLDTYHHTFFEMLGNWSFGDYFKKEAIAWAWELLVERWGFPKERLYATVYQPGPGEPATFDQEAWECWADVFRRAGLDPARHIRTGGKKDNFWMMGDTGPCGPCSEIHADLTPRGDTGGRLVNAGAAECMEIWNLVFIQFNAEADGSLADLPAKHVDTGMGFERACGILQCTKNLTDFGGVISNYETDIFRPIFARLAAMSGKAYASTLPSPQPTPQERVDIAFRVIADHIRTLSFAIADGISPSNEGRGFVLRRILRRAARFGRALGFQQPFFYELAETVAEGFGDVFPELRQKLPRIREMLLSEEKSFNHTLDRGLAIFEEEIAKLEPARESHAETEAADGAAAPRQFPAETAFLLHDTYGFPLDLTQLMARERGLAVDLPGFEKLMEEQRARARAAQKKEVIAVEDAVVHEPTRFVGYDQLEASARILAVVESKGRPAVLLDATPFYAEMGGQVGDVGHLTDGAAHWRIVDTQSRDGVHFHLLESADAPTPSLQVRAAVNAERRAAIQRHHTATHLFHWAIHEVADRESRQRGSYVCADYLRFDFNLAHALTPAQIAEIERLVNARIAENVSVSWVERPYAEVQNDPSIQQFFGEKYGAKVRVVQIGDFSKELCGGTHCRSTGELGSFRICKEMSVAAGIRRVEAVAGAAVDVWLAAQETAHAEAVERERRRVAKMEEEKRRLAEQEKRAAEIAATLLDSGIQLRRGIPTIVTEIPGAEASLLRLVADALREKDFQGVVVLGGTGGGRCSFTCFVADVRAKNLLAGEIVKRIAAAAGGAGGGRPDFAQAGGKDPSKMGEALALAAQILDRGSI
ncbi:MAG: alanine--tRNA ligase [Verrucomicrobiae bacterium]|nr:alanine--tRNA ligase [Verrucomicrobiae bacterium]